MLWYGKPINNYIIISSWRRKQNNIVSILQDIARSKLNSLSNLENRIFHGSYLQQNLEWLKPKSESIVHFSLRQSWRIKTWIFASLLPSLTTEFPKSSAGKRELGIFRLLCLCGFYPKMLKWDLSLIQTDCMYQLCGLRFLTAIEDTEIYVEKYVIKIIFNIYIISRPRNTIVDLKGGCCRSSLKLGQATVL